MLEIQPSISAIKTKIKSDLVFTFCHIVKEEVIKEVKNLDASKGSKEDDIPTKIIKENRYIFQFYISELQ